MRHINSRSAGLHALLKTKPMVFFTVGLVAVSALLQTQLISLSPPWLEVVSAALALFVLPGYLFTQIVVGADSLDPLELLGISFVLGAALLILPATILPLVGGTLDMLIGASIGIQLVLASLAVWRMSHGDHGIAVSLGSLPALWGVNLLVLVPFLLTLVLVIRALFPANVLGGGADSWVYLQIVRRYLDKPYLDPADPLLGGVIHPRLLLTGWLAVEALMSRIASVDPLSLHATYLPPILVLASFLSLYSLARVLLGTSEGGMVACLVQAVYVFSSFLSEASEGVPGAVRGIGCSVLQRIFEDKILCWQVLLPVLILFAARFLTTGRRGYWWAWMLAAAAVTVVHPIGWAYLVLSVGSFLLVHIIMGPGRRNRLRVVAVVVPIVVLSAVPVAQHILAASKVPMYFDFWYDVAADARYYVEIIRFLSHPLTLLALVLTPALLPFVRGRLAAKWAFSNMAVPLLALANPLTKFMLTEFLDTTPLLLAMRSLRVLPVSLTVAFFVCHCSGLIRQRIGRRLSPACSRLAKSGVPVALIAVMAGALTGSIRASISYMPVIREESGLHRDEMEVLQHLAGALQQESAVWMDDAWMGLHVYAFTTYAVVTDLTVYERLLRPIDPQARLKIDDEDDFFDRNLVTQSSLEAVAAADAATIVVRNDNPLACQLASLSSMFSETLRNPTYSVFRVSPAQWTPEAVEGNTRLYVGDSGGAVSIYTRGLASNPDDTLSLLGRGIAFWHLGDIARAERDLQVAIETSRDDRCRAPLYTLRLALYAEAQHAQEPHLQELIREFQQSAAGLSHAPSLHRKLADLYAQTSRVDQAVAEYEKALGQTPSKTSGEQRELCSLLWSGGLLEEAVEACSASLESFPYSAPAHSLLGLTYRSLGLLDAAATESMRAIKLKPYDSATWCRLGKVYERLQQPWAAARLYSIALWLSPHKSRGYEFQAALRARTGGPHEAIAIWHVAVETVPHQAWAHMGLGDAYWNAGRKDGALSAYLKAVDLEPANARACKRLGDYYAEDGQTSEASAAYAQAIRLDPEDSEHVVDLVRLLREEGSLEEAAELERRGTINGCLPGQFIEF